MNIICHRGYWSDKSEQNTLYSFSESTKRGYGIELDVRFSNGNLVIAHDLADNDSILLTDALKVIDGCKSYILVNIKEDNICQKIAKLFDQYNIKYFLFDMSVPETVICSHNSLSFFTRLSEFETFSKLDEKSKGFWLDSFEEEWFDSELIYSILNDGKEIVIVSSELHCRDYKELWSMLKQFSDYSNISICTDFPDMANEYFNLN